MIKKEVLRAQKTFRIKIVPFFIATKKTKIIKIITTKMRVNFTRIKKMEKPCGHIF